MKSGPDSWEWAHERDARLLKEDGWMCEEHPGVEWPHGECPGPGMPWILTGRKTIENLIKPSQPL